MKKSDIVKFPSMACPFAANANFSKSKYWTDEEVKDGFKKILQNNGKNNGFMTLEDLNRFGYNMTETAFANQIGIVNMFDKEYCEKIGGYPNGARVFGTIKGQLVEAFSLVDNNKIDFQTEGIDGINWAGEQSIYSMPSSTPKRKLVELKWKNGDDSDFVAHAPTEDKAKVFVADKDMWVCIDLSELSYEPISYTVNVPKTTKENETSKSDMKFTMPAILNVICYVGSGDLNPKQCLPNIKPIEESSNPWRHYNIYEYSEESYRWSCHQFSFPAKLYKSATNEFLCSITTEPKDNIVKAVEPIRYFGVDGAFYLRKGFQMKIYAFYLYNATGVNVLGENEAHSIYLSEY